MACRRSLSRPPRIGGARRVRTAACDFLTGCVCVALLATAASSLPCGVSPAAYFGASVARAPPRPAASSLLHRLRHRRVERRARLGPYALAKLCLQLRQRVDLEHSADDLEVGGARRPRALAEGLELLARLLERRALALLFALGVGGNRLGARLGRVRLRLLRPLGLKLRVGLRVLGLLLRAHRRLLGVLDRLLLGGELLLVRKNARVIVVRELDEGL